MEDKKKIPLPTDSIVYYVTINPKSQCMALTKTKADIDEYLRNCPDNFRKINLGQKLDPFPNIDGILKNHIHKSPAKYIDFDVKHTDIVTQQKVMNYFDYKAIWPCIVLTVFTRRGFNILLDVNKITGVQRRELYLYGKENGLFTTNNDSQIPIAGTYQGGHIVKMIDLKNHWINLFKQHLTNQ